MNTPTLKNPSIAPTTKAAQPNPTRSEPPEMPPTPLIRDVPLALTPVNQAFVLGNLDETSLVNMMAIKAGIQDPSWLRTMVEGGLIDVDFELKGLATEGDMKRLLTQFRDRSLALTHFLKNADERILRVPPLEGTQTPYYVFQAEEEFKALFHQSTHRMLQSMGALFAHPKFGDIAMDADRCEGGHLIAVASRWMAAACLLDSPDTLKLLTQKFQPAIFEAFPLEKVGDSFYDSTHHLPKPPQPSLEDGERAPAILVTPAFVALMLSRHECLDVLWEANKKGLMTLGSVYDGDSDERENLDIRSLHKYFAPVCKPEAYTYALELFVKSDNAIHVVGRQNAETQSLYNALHDIDIDAIMPVKNTDPAIAEIHRQAKIDGQTFKMDQLHQVALDILPDPMHAMRPYVRSFIEAGIYDFGIADSVVQAVAHGHPNVVENFRGRIPWAEILPQNDLGKSLYAFADANPIYLAAVQSRDNNENTPDGAAEAAVLAFIDAAKHDGHIDQVLAHGSATHVIELKVAKEDRLVGVNVVEPIAALIDAGMPRAIVKFLENGLDPQSKPNPATPSVLETADLKSPEIGQTIRTYLNRQRAMAALDEIHPPKACAAAGPGA